jgi:hypothetical protein
MKTLRTTLWISAAVVALAGLAAAPAAADQLFLDDVIVDGSLCVGIDCVNGESFGFDTIRLKENNLRIKFQDTSSSASFPTNDWQLTANDSANGGANKFSIDDIDGGRTPFTIEASAPSHSLYVDSSGDLGLGTSIPVVDLHVVSGNTPTLRLEQDGSSGFAPQTWDVAGNEAGFFIRDVTNGSQLSLRIRPGAPSSSIDIAADGDVGIGTGSPSSADCGLNGTDDCAVHVRRTNGQASLFVEEASSTEAQRVMLVLENNGAVQTELRDTTANTWRFGLNNNGDFVINDTGDLGTAEMQITTAGVVSVNGGQVHPDYVFESDYELMTLPALEDFIGENKHLPGVISSEAADGRIDLSSFPLQLLEKIEELTLYTLQQQKTIDALQARMVEMEQAKQ